MKAITKNDEIELHDCIPIFFEIDGKTITNYNLESEEKIKKDGWLEVEENKPSYNSETQYLEIESKNIVDGIVIVTYVAVEISEQI